MSKNSYELTALSNVLNKSYKSLQKKHLYLLLLIIVFIIFTVFIPSAILNLTTKNRRYDLDNNISEVPFNNVGIVFGAGANSDYTPTPYLKDRLDVAVKLYQTGKIKKLLMSGDNGVSHYNEPLTMKNYAVSKGVQIDDVAMDYAGFSTYDTCYRAHEIFGINEATLITHGYHLPRAITTCNKLNVKSIGLIVNWKSEKSIQTNYRYKLRELLATNKAFIELFITRPKPKFLGAKEQF